MGDIPKSPEAAMVREDIGARWKTSWDVVDKSGGTNVRAISRLFLRSVFAPKQLSQLPFSPDVQPEVQKLSSFSPYNSTQPSEQMLADAERTLVKRVLDLEPPIVPQALETLDALAKKGELTIWTVGDYLGATHDLPEEIKGSQERTLGTGHQLWKLWKLGITEKPDIRIGVSDNKINDVLPRIQRQEAAGRERFIFLDDTFSNLEKVKQVIEEENNRRALTGDDPITYDLLLVNQGRRRTIPPPELSMRGAMGTFGVIDQFSQAPGKIQELSQGKAESTGIFCDFDGVVTDNAAVRQRWDDIAQDVVEETVALAKLKNPQKEKRGGGKLTPEDLTSAAVQGYLEACRAKGLRIGVKNGAYDLLQPGHLGGFDDARAACDVLIVLLNSDASIREYKGVKEGVPRPILPETDRADILLGLESVNGVVIFSEENPADAIRALRPDVYISSAEYEGKNLAEFDAAASVGADVVFTNMREGYSTSSIVRSILEGAESVKKQEPALAGV